MRIGELAKLAGCPVVTVRYYEKEGLLPRPARTGNNYRLYDQKDLERLKFILHCRKHGLKQEEIYRLLQIRDNRNLKCDYAHKVIEEQLARVEEQIASLELLKKELSELNRAKGCHNQKDCPILLHLADAALCGFYQAGKQKA